MNALTGASFQWGGYHIRRSFPDDSESLAELFRRTYRNSSHPFQTPEQVYKFLMDPRNYQIIAEKKGHIVSSMAMAYYPWNSSYELGRALTDSDHRCAGLAAALMQRVVGWVSDAALGDVFFGYPRVRRIVDLCSGLEPPMLTVGHDAGRNVANGSREVHVIVAGLPSLAKFDHVGPECSLSSACATLQSRIYGKLRLRWRPGPYPPLSFVGDLTESVIESGEFLISYPRTPNKAIEILSFQPADAAPAQICSRLEECLRSFPEVQHATATILADKHELIECLRSIGFRITAYLPAWYPLGRARFDCIQMASVRYSGPTDTHDLGSVVAEFDDKLPFAVGTAGLAALPTTGVPR